MRTAPRPTSRPQPVLTAALAYLRRGLSVIPIRRGDKRPLVAWEAYQQRRPTEREVRAWWGRGPEANIGIVTGSISGVIVLDADGSDGQRTIQDLPIPPTWRARTGKGEHIYFKHPSGIIANFTRRLPGLDLRGDGGYALAPPSVHPSGRSYTWIAPPEAVALADPPDWLLALLAPADNGARGPAPPIPEAIREGERNTWLTSFAGTLRRRGLSAQEIRPILNILNAGRCEPLLDENEVLRIAESIERYPAGDQGGRGDQVGPGVSRGRASQADTLVGLALESGVELFHSPDGETSYAVVPVREHIETWAIRSTGFKRWLTNRFYSITHKAPSSQALEDARKALEARAQFEGPSREVFVRVGHAGGAVYLDLADETWRAVEITPNGWRVVSRPPVAFRRARGMEALPEPRRGGSLDGLREFVNVGSDDDWRLVAGWAHGTLHPTGPYPTLAFHAEQGAGKTTAAKGLRLLIDPNTSLVRADPREVRDLMIAATNGWIVAFDNVSRLPIWLSDALCRLATGGGFATRELYTDQDEILFEAKRPVLLNGIEEIVTRGDLLDRAVIVYLPQIPEERRRQEREFWSAFQATHPYLLGALLDGVVGAIKHQDQVQLDRRPRMADFAVWVTAAEPALGWPAGSFLQAYTQNRAAGAELELEGSSVALALRALMEQSPGWEGTATQLLKTLAEYAGEDAVREKTWPKRPQNLGGVIRRLAPNLRTTGIMVEIIKPKIGGSRKTIYTITHKIPPGPPELPDSRGQGAQGLQRAQDSPRLSSGKGAQGPQGGQVFPRLSRRALPPGGAPRPPWIEQLKVRRRPAVPTDGDAGPDPNPNPFIWRRPTAEPVDRADLEDG